MLLSSSYENSSDEEIAFRTLSTTSDGDTGPALGVHAVKQSVTPAFLADSARARYCIA